MTSSHGRGAGFEAAARATLCLDTSTVESKVEELPGASFFFSSSLAVATDREDNEVDGLDDSFFEKRPPPPDRPRPKKDVFLTGGLSSGRPMDDFGAGRRSAATRRTCRSCCR